MKKLLLITSRLPYPPIGGDRLKNYNLIKILSKYCDIHLVSITNEEVDSKAMDFLEQYTIYYKIFKKNKLDFILSASKSFFNKKPIQVNYYYFNNVQNYINDISNEVDIIISTLVRTTEYVKDINKPKIFDMADSIAQNYMRSLPNVKSLFWKFIYQFEYNRLLKYEKKMINKFDLTFMFNKEEIKFFNNKKIHFIPHGVNEELLNYENTNSKYKNSICFFGKMDYQPNIDAVIWFVENVLDKLNKNITFLIVGVNPSEKIKKLEKKYNNVKVTGFVKDPYEILKSALCIVAPMQTGAGIQNKILESMALGTINIVSSLAATPITARNRKDYIVLDNPYEIANEINNIFKNRDKYEYYKINSREFIKNNFTWKIYEKIYISNIERILNDNKN